MFKCIFVKAAQAFSRTVHIHLVLNEQMMVTRIGAVNIQSQPKKKDNNENFSMR